MNKSDFTATLTRYVHKAGSQSAAAKRLGVSGAYLSDVKNGRREPGEKLLTALGLKRVVSYERSN